MAQEARNEPTMEEILSSIRRIIAEDSEAADSIVAGDHDTFGTKQDDDGNADEVDYHDDFEEAALTYAPKGPTAELDAALAALRSPVEEAPGEGEDDFEPLDQGFDAEAANDVDDFGGLVIDDEVVASSDAVVEDLADVQSDAGPVESVAARAGSVKGDREMLTAPLSDDRTAEAAAGYLSRLLQQIEFGEKGGSQQTIDNLVKELLRPMMKQWLDENLAPIVERQVEAEVARIARMAR